jgi:hypothetical protein
MAVLQHALWGYQLTYPDGWVHQTFLDTDIFASRSEALDADYIGPEAGQLVVRGEWNWSRQPVEPFWTRHIGMLAGMAGARKVGSAPWILGRATGLEAEIVLPKKENMRLWTGILARDFRILKFVVIHPLEERARFEPVATKIITSLRFPNRILGLETGPEGLPLPPGYSPADPQEILPDIAQPELWRAYEGESAVGALQAFFLREAPVYNWEVEEYLPFPGGSELGFARLRLRRGERVITLGIMPFDREKVSTSSPAKLVLKLA